MSICYSIRMRYGVSGWTPVRGGSGGSFKYASLQTNETITSVRALYTSLKIYNGAVYKNGYVLCSLGFSTSMNTYQFNSCNGVGKTTFMKDGLVYISGRFGNYINLLRLWSFPGSTEIWNYI